MGLEQQRREYRYGRLTRNSLQPSPYDQFQVWLQQALDAGITDPTAMSLATVDAEGRPWQRIVLLKGFDASGFVFYTNLESRKARSMEVNDAVSIHFPWLSMDRQVIVGGVVQRLDKAREAAYFASRPRESQLAAWTSAQSEPIGSRRVLEEEYQRMVARFGEGEIPKPDFWGGYRVVPREFEFWQGGENRLHDRFRYMRLESGWQIDRLAP